MKHIIIRRERNLWIDFIHRVKKGREKGMESAESILKKI